MIFFRFPIYLLGLLLGISINVAAQSIRVAFDYNSASIRPVEITKIEETVMENPFAEWSIEGRSSSKGSEDYNMALSKKRASAVSEMLQSIGVPKARINSVYIGENQANQTSDEATDRIVLLSYKMGTSPKEEKIQTMHKVIIQVIDALDKKALSGSYKKVDETSAPFPNSTFVELIPEEISANYIFHAEGYRDSTIQMNAKSGRVTVELFPENVLEKLTVDNIYFYPNSAEIIPESFRALEDLYKQLIEKRGVKIEIRGHINWPHWMASTPQLDIEHQDLSERRAKAVMDWLVKKGISADILSYKGLSNTQMLYPDAEAEGQMQFNRRVEIIVLKK